MKDWARRIVDVFSLDNVTSVPAWTVVIMAALFGLAGCPQHASAGVDAFQVRVFPQISYPGADLTITIEHVGELTEATYCLGLEITWAEGTTTKHSADCPPWDEYIKREKLAAWCEEQVIVCPEGYDCYLPSCRTERYTLQRRWTFSTRRQRIGYGPGQQQVVVRFILPNNKTVTRFATFFVGGGE